MNYVYTGAFLGIVFVVMTIGLASDAIFYSPDPEQEGFAIAVLDEPAGGAEEEEEEGLGLITPLLASADIEAGASVFRKCQSCHNVEQGGANQTGPNLWNVVNAVPGHHEGFNYSDALLAYGETGQVWDFEALNRFLHAPRDYIPGTTMGFAGLRSEEERRDIIAWLAQQNDNPVPLPTAEEAAAMLEETDAPGDGEGEAAPADDAAAGEDDGAMESDAAPAEDAMDDASDAAEEGDTADTTADDAMDATDDTAEETPETTE